LNSPGENDQLDLIESELSDRLGGSESSIPDGDEICDGAGADVPFSVAQTKDVCRSGSDHLIQRIGGQADFCAREVDFVEQIAGGGEWGVAAQHDGVEGYDQRG